MFKLERILGVPRWHVLVGSQIQGVQGGMSWPRKDDKGQPRWGANFPNGGGLSCYLFLDLSLSHRARSHHLILETPTAWWTSIS